MADEKLAMLLKLRNGLEDQIRHIQRDEYTYTERIADLKGQYKACESMKGLVNRKEILEVILHSINHEELQLEQLLNYKRQHEEHLNQQLYRTCKSMAALASRHPFGHYCLA
ncbi:hypothetical protein V1498_11775 [Peribacillus sp. SCS-26]|uniref:hypothetical protein n=1 Tax=Paraperibacillus marinus TaxID=3115295 RepID=UPI0039061262